MAHGRMGSGAWPRRRRGGAYRARIQHFAGHPKQHPGGQNRPGGAAGARVLIPCAHGPNALILYIFYLTCLNYGLSNPTLVMISVIQHWLWSH